MVQIGCSSACLYPMPTEQAVQTLLDAGVKTLEIFFNAFCELSGDLLCEIRSRVEAAGARVVSLHPFSSGFEHMMFFSGYSRRVDDSIAFYRQFFEAAKTLGASYFVLHGDKLGHDKIDIDQYCAIYARLYEVAESYGIVVAQENVNGFKSASVDFIRAMRQRLGDRVRFVLDLKQCVRSGTDVYEMADTMGDRLCHLHLSDHRPEAACLPPGSGHFDFQAFSNYIQTQHPQVQTGVLELYRSNFSDHSELFSSWQVLQQSFC